jgi:hypothetical protein
MISVCGIGNSLARFLDGATVLEAEPYFVVSIYVESVFRGFASLPGPPSLRCVPATG